MSLGDVLWGGGLTLAGTYGAELLRSRTASRDRISKREDSIHESNRAILKELRAAASAYREQLTEYRRETANGATVSDPTDRKLQTTRMAHQAIVYEADDSIISALEAWENEAVNWSQRVGSAAKENRLWTEAMKACGQQSRATRKLK